MRKRNKGFNKQAFTLLSCFIIAFGLWIYVTYEEDPSLTRWETGVEINISGESKLFENSLAISEMSVEKVDIKFSAPRSRFRYLSDNAVKASIDVSKITTPGSHNLDIALDYPSDFTVVDRRRTSVTIEVEEYVKDKFFTAEPVYKKQPENGYSVKSATIEGRDMLVSLSGPISKVGLVEKILTEPIDLSGVVDDTTKAVTFVPVDSEGKEVKGVKLSTEEANITFVIYKTASVPIEVVFYNNGDSPKLDYTMSATTVGITGPAKIVDAVENIPTQAFSEYNYKAGSQISLNLILPDSNITFCDDALSQVTLTFEKAE